MEGIQDRSRELDVQPTPESTKQTWCPNVIMRIRHLAKQKAT